MTWAKNKNNMWNNESAIVVFRFANYNAMKKNKSNKYFMDASNEWETVTTLSRKCQDNILDDYDFIYGPMVANPYRVENHNEVAKPHNDIKWQFASKTYASDNILKKSIYGVIWLKK